MKDRLINLYNHLLNLLPTNLYEIKHRYRINHFTREYVDDENMAVNYQRDVYKKARELIKKNNLKRVLDVGCGNGVKLIEFIAPHVDEFIGVDMATSIEYCKSHYDTGNWYVDDIQNPKLTLEKPVDLIISSDVIEHLQTPDKIFEYFRRFSDENTIIIISTPERNLVRGIDHMGPPPNKAHVREWNREEFAKYLKGQNFKIITHEIVQDVEGDFTDSTERRYGKTCQLIVGKLILGVKKFF